MLNMQIFKNPFTKIDQGTIQKTIKESERWNINIKISLILIVMVKVLKAWPLEVFVLFFGTIL